MVQPQTGDNNILIMIRKDFFRISGIVIIFVALILIVNSCKKNPNPPELTTADVSNITQSSAMSGGNVTDDGGATVIERGVCWNTFENPTISYYRTIEDGEMGYFTSSITELTPNTLYYIRAYATNEAGTGYGNQITFTTILVLPSSLTTRTVSSITASGAVSGGNITDDGGGTITEKGVCWSTTENPSISNSKTIDGSGKEGFNSYITDLDPVTTYYVRAYSTNGSGTSYGNQLSFTTTAEENNPVIFNPDLTYNSVSDVNGNSYKTIQIGNQVWMAENLKCTNYNDGSAIANIIDDVSWNSVTTGAYCWYNNDISNKEIYGALYNWYSLSTEKLCPTGWHIPDDAEWMTLIDNIGGMAVAGGKMKEISTIHWLNPNTGATNESGFTGLPGGVRSVEGYFNLIRSNGRYWKSGNLNIIEISYDSGEVNTDTGCIWRRGMSVRCLKDQP